MHSDARSVFLRWCIPQNTVVHFKNTPISYHLDTALLSLHMSLSPSSSIFVELNPCSIKGS